MAERADPRFLLALAWRELRGARARAASFLGALAVGVAAVVLVAGLSDSVGRSARLEARPTLGADVAASARRPLPDLAAAEATEPGVERVDTVDFATMAAAPAGADGAPGRSMLVELKAVGPGWPFYGAPETAPADALAVLDDAGVLVEPGVLERLGLDVGAPLRIGSATFTVRGRVLAEPGRLPTGLVVGPRALVTLGGLERSGLGGIGARVTYKALYRVPDEARASALAAALREAGGAWLSVQTWSDAQPSFRRSLERSTSFLGLVALLALLVGGVGVAQATRAWMAQRLDALAIQRTLGLTSVEVAGVAAVQTATLALGGGLVGAALGTAVLALVPSVLAGVLPAEAVVPWQPVAVMRGIGLGVGIALAFAAEPLWRAASVPAMRVLRRDVEPLPPAWWQRLAWGLVLAVVVGALAWVQAGDLLVAAVFVGALVLVVGLGAAGATLAARGAAAVGGRAPQWWLRHGLLALGRPGSGLVPAVVSLALGVVVVLTTVLVEGRLYAQIAQEFPATAPSAFLVDVQPDQEAGVRAALEAAGGTRIRTVPMVVARLASVDGVAVDTLAAARPEADRWSLTREQRLTWQADLGPGNTLVAGAPFSDAVAAELSVEERYAGDIGAHVGSTVVFDVQGVPVPFTVTSLRRVAWESFEVNFFLVAEPGALDGAPYASLMTTQLGPEVEAGVQDQLAARWPNVTMVSVRSALEQVRGVLSKLAWGIRAVGTFTALAGVAILASGVAADAARRGRQVALYKTLGVTRGGVMAVFAVEYALVGLLAGGLGAVGAVGVSWALVTQLMRLGWRTDGAAVAAGVGTAAVACAAVGIAANLRALRVRPAEVLRGD